MNGEVFEDMERLPQMSMEMLLLQKKYARQQWWVEQIDKELKRRNNSRTDDSVAIVLRKTAAV